MKRIREHNINTSEHFDAVFAENPNQYNSYKNIQCYDKILNLGLFKERSYLDFGCGNGNALNEIAENNPTLKITGVDISKKVISENKKRFQLCNFKTTEEFFNNKEAYDVTLSSHTFEHLDDPIDTASKLLSVTNKKMLIIVPYKDSWALCPQHLWVFDSKSFDSLSPTVFLSGFTNRAGYTEALYFWDKSRNYSFLEKLLLKIKLFLFKCVYNHPIGIIKKILFIKS